jgi:hypothetical protein
MTISQYRIDKAAQVLWEQHRQATKNLTTGMMMVEWDKLHATGKATWRGYAKAVLEADEILRQQPDMLEGDDENQEK